MKGYFFMIDKYENLSLGEERALYNGGGADRPPRLVSIDEADLEPHDHDAEHDRRPVQPFILDEQVPALSQCEVQRRRRKRGDEVRHRQRRERAHARGAARDV